MIRSRFARGRTVLRAGLSFGLMLGLLLSLAPQGTEAALDDYAVDGGWFYTQARGDEPAGNGFAVIDTANIDFYSMFEKLGGVDALGYPVSNRFTWDGAVVQAFQRGALEYRPDSGVQISSIFSTMSQAGLDDWLNSTYAVPAPVAPNPGLLAANPDIAAAYDAIPNAAAILGAPVALEDFGPVQTLRTQNLAIQQWKVDTNFAPAGGVIIPNAGDVLAASGAVPVEALKARHPQAFLYGAGGRYPYAAVRSPQPYYYTPYYPYWAPQVNSQPYYPYAYNYGYYYQPYAYNYYARPMVYPYYVYGAYAPYTYGYQPYAYNYGPYAQTNPWPYWWGGYGYPQTPPQQVVCQGDEQMIFNPGHPNTGQTFTIDVTSSRPSVNISFDGPGNPQFQGAFSGGKGYIWRWTANIGSSGTYNFNFRVAGTVCTANVVSVG